MEGLDLVGVSDVNVGRCRDIAHRYGCQAFINASELMSVVDAVVVAAPTTSHYDIAKKCMLAGVHVLVEKPLAHDLSAAKKLVDLAKEMQVVLMVGHIERYNPVIMKMIEMLQSENEPIVSFHANRLAPFDGSRCMDVDVTLDLLIHDIDLFLNIVDSEVIDIAAFGRKVYSQGVDVVHVSMKVANNVIASFWTSRCSPQKLRSIMVSTPHCFYEANTLEQRLRVSRTAVLPDVPGGCPAMGPVCSQAVKVASKEPLRNELADFVHAIVHHTSPIVNGERALRSLSILDRVTSLVYS
jgi:predicted dehydrogenase